MSRDVFVTELVADDSSYGRAIDRAIANNLQYQKSAQKTVDGNRRLSQEFTKAGRSVADIDGPLSSVTQKLDGYATAIGGVGLAVGGTATAMVASVQQVADSAVELDNLSRIAAMTVEDFQAAAYATEQFGISADKLADISKDTNEKLGEFIATGGGGFKDFFEQVALQVGLTAESLQGLSGPQVLGAVKNALDAVNISAEKQTWYLESIAGDASLLSPLLADNAKKLNKLTAEYDDLGIAMSSVDIATMREANQQLSLLSQLLTGTFNKAVVDGVTAVNELANSQQAAEVASLAMFVAAGRLTGAVTNKTAAVYKDVQATKLAEQATVSRLAIEAKAARSEQMAAQAALAQAQKQTQWYGMLSRSARDAAAAKKTLAVAQQQVTITTQQATLAQNALTTAQQKTTIATQGLAVAGRTLRGTLALVGGPAGAVMMAVGALAYLVTRSDDAAEANRNLADSTEELTEKLDTLTTKQLKVARLDASATVRQLERDLKQVTRDIEDTPTTVTISAYTTGGKPMETIYQAGIDKVTRLEAKQEDLNEKLANTRTYLNEIDAALNPEARPKVKDEGDEGGGNDNTPDEVDLTDLEALRDKYTSKEQLLLDSTLREQEILIAAQNNRLISEQEAQALSKQSWDQYYAEVAQLTQSSADKQVDIQRGAAQSMVDTLTGDVETTDQLFQGFASGMSSAMADAALSGELSFGKMAESIISDMMRIYIQAQIVKPLMEAMGVSFGTPKIDAGTDHTGGIAGIADAGSRTVPLSTFAGAPRFHTGGIIGSEVPIIAQRGEGVFTPEQMKRLSPVGNSPAKVSIQIINNGQPAEVERTEQSQNGDMTQIKMWIRDVVNSDLNSGGGWVRTFETRYPGIRGMRKGYG